MNTPERVIYLHGFASSPASRKASFLSQKLRERGFRVDIPNLDDGDFQHLTITRQLAKVSEVAADDPVTIVGSSMGGYLAALFASQHRSVKRMVLLAPAFDFEALWKSELGAKRLREWEKTNALQVFHYRLEREVPLSFDLMRDVRQYEGFPTFDQPTLILHGTEDQTVPLAASERIAQGRPNIKLVPVSSGHELTNVLDRIWQEMEGFLLLR